MREYISRGGYAASDTNDLISNLKKDVSRRGLTEWKYKVLAMHQAAEELAAALAEWPVDETILVPIPPSKTEDDEEYDPRMQWIARRVAKLRGIEWRPLLRTQVSREPLHSSDKRRDIQALTDSLEINEDVAEPAPKEIALVDDMLTTGASFIAAKTVLERRFPGVSVFGIFIARRIFLDP